MDRDLVWIPNVRALSEGDALVCQIQGHRAGVPKDEIMAESHVRKPGDYGVLVIARAVAERLGFPVLPPSEPADGTAVQ
jgi:hypothetical protein